MRNYLDATINFLYGNGCDVEEKLFYSRRQRKCKMAVMGITTFISITAVIVDWYNFVHYAELTHQRLIFTEDSATDTIYRTFLTLCIISTLFLIAELVAFVLQLKYTRIYDAPFTKSEFVEEIVSAGLLFFQSVGLPLLFIIGTLFGMCSVTAQIRSFSGRLALLLAAISSIWRLIQSFAYCCLCRQEPKMPFCQTLRGFRAFFIAFSLAIITSLACVFFSLDISLKVDIFNGRYHGEQFGDTIEGVFLYQRHLTPYQFIEQDGTTSSCSFYETRIKIADPKDFESIHKELYSIRLNCSDISDFYSSFIDEYHQPLMSSYTCNLVIRIKTDELRSTRIVNAIYELRDPLSSSCISGPVDLVLDTEYDPEENYAMKATELWSSKTIQGIRDSLCPGDMSCQERSVNESYDNPSFNCTSDSCVTSSSDAGNGSSIALVSHLIVSERQMLSYYPCMPYVDLHHQLDFNSCESEMSTEMVGDIIEYGSCMDTYLSHDQLTQEWNEEEAEVMSQYN